MFSTASKTEEITMVEPILTFLKSTGFSALTLGSVVMMAVACVLLYLAIVKKFEPLLLVPIAFGVLLSNLPLAGMMSPPVLDVQGSLSRTVQPGGLLYYLYQGNSLGIFPPLIFLGVGAMTDFGPLIANPKSLLLGAAAQVGIFLTFVGAILTGLFNAQEAASIGIIGGADGPTAIFLSSQLAPHLLGPIAISAYSYMAMVPIIQPPIMRLLTTKKERMIRMTQLREVGKKERILFPIVVTVVVSLLVPPAATLIGMLMLGNLFRECGVVARLDDTAKNALINIITIFLGVTVGATASAEKFLTVQTLAILGLGVTAFAISTAGGVLLAKLMNLFLKVPINPLIGSAGVSAVPMAARVSQVVGQKDDPGNFLLMHAMGPNVAGVIGSAVAAGVMLSLFGR
jgi:carboxybiotin decarboxylase